MKKAYLLLSLLLAALLLFTACTEEPTQNDAQPPVSDNDAAKDNTPVTDDNKISDTTPPVSGDDTAQDKVQTNTQPKLPEVWRNMAGDKDYKSVTIRREISRYGYDANGTALYERTLFYELEQDDELYYITTLTDSPDVPSDANISGFDFSLDFENYVGSVDTVDMFLTRFAKNGKRYLGIKKDGETQWLNSAAILYFDDICAEVGLNSENFFFDPYTDMITSIAHVSLEKPFVISDPNRELDVYEAAYKLVESIYISYSTPAPNRTFVVTSYEQPEIKVYLSADNYKLSEEDQWLVSPPTQKFEYEGITEGEGSLPVWLMEYRCGEWRLYCRHYDSNIKKTLIEPTNVKPTVNDPAEWPGTENLNEYSCGRATVVRELNDGGYDETGLVFRKDTIKYDLGHGFATGLNYILTLTDDAAHYNYISYKAFEFTVDFSTDDKDAITLIYARRTNDMSNCLGIKNGTEITWLKKEAVGYFEVLCLNNGLTEENFLFLCPQSSLTTMNVGMPFILKDENREKTAEQAAKELLLGILEDYSTYAYNRTFVVKSYTDWQFKLLDANSDIGSGDDVHRVKSLGENQWLVLVLEPDAVIEGPREEGGSENPWLLEYQDGQWQLWTRRTP
ncbi:MAG: hypothetical protein IJE90_00635 [Clostridia bacterium]|nr:hypothetical protein [Clostridia bacterium]